MKRQLLFVCLVVLLTGESLFAQQKRPTQAEVNKMAQEMQKRAQSGKPLTEAEMKEMLKKMGVEQDIKIPASSTPEAKPSGPKTPVTNKPLHGRELIDFVMSMRAKIKKKMDPSDLELVYDLIDELDSSVKKIEQVAVYAFYKGARAQAVLLATEAVLLDPGNDLHV
ncbi:MAG: hypothetical protein EOO05_05135, partial [Chitinophagaceae bacterium]